MYHLYNTYSGTLYNMNTSYVIERKGEWTLMSNNISQSSILFLAALFMDHSCWLMQTVSERQSLQCFDFEFLQFIIYQWLSQLWLCVIWEWTSAVHMHWYVFEVNIKLLWSVKAFSLFWSVSVESLPVSQYKLCCTI